MMFSSVNTYNFHSNVKEIKKNIDKPTVSTASNGVHDIYTPSLYRTNTFQSVFNLSEF